MFPQAGFTLDAHPTDVKMEFSFRATSRVHTAGNMVPVNNSHNDTFGQEKFCAGELTSTTMRSRVKASWTKGFVKRLRDCSVVEGTHDASRPSEPGFGFQILCESTCEFPAPDSFPYSGPSTPETGLGVRNERHKRTAIAQREFCPSH